MKTAGALSSDGSLSFYGSIHSIIRHRLSCLHLDIFGWIRVFVDLDIYHRWLYPFSLVTYCSSVSRNYTVLSKTLLSAVLVHCVHHDCQVHLNSVSCFLAGYISRLHNTTTVYCRCWTPSQVLQVVIKLSICMWLSMPMMLTVCYFYNSDCM